MEIKIDTKKDSAEDIRKAIRVLQNLLGEAGSGTGSNDIEATDEVVSGMAGLFGDDPMMGESDEKKDDDNEGDDGVELMTY